MSTFVKRVSEYNGKQQVELVGMAQLTQGLNEKFLEYTNAKGETKRYKLGNAKVELPNGKTAQVVVSIAEKTLDNMANSGNEFTAGDSYLTSLSRVESTKEPGKMIWLARMSHLQGGLTDNDALNDAFGDMFEAVEAPVQANA